MKKLLLLLLFVAGMIWAQPGNPVVQFRNSDPTGSCSPQPMWYNYTLGKLWGCKAGTWTLLVNGGTGATIASTTNIIQGDGAGNGVDSGWVPLDTSAGGSVFYGTGMDLCVTSYPAGGGTATLTKLSCRTQVTAGAGAITFKLPDATTLGQAGSRWVFVNNGTSTMTIQDSTTGAITTVPTLQAAFVYNTDISTAAGTWTFRYDVPASIPAHNVVGNNTGSAAVPTTVRLACADLSDSASGCSTAAGGTANQNVRSFGAAFDGGGSALTTAKVAYITVPFACTISGYNITADTGTIDFDIWKIATGTAIPTVTNTIISGASYLALSSGTAVHSTSTGSFTSTTVTAFDIVGVKIHAVSSATLASLVIPCTAN